MCIHRESESCSDLSSSALLTMTVLRGGGAGVGGAVTGGGHGAGGRGLHSSTFLLNLSALYGIGGARRGYVARVKGVLGGV
jgi:hypothetical protein